VGFSATVCLRAQLDRVPPLAQRLRRRGSACGGRPAGARL